MSNEAKRPPHDPLLGITDLGTTGQGVVPSELDPWEATPSSASVEGKVALEVLPDLVRTTSMHAPVRPRGRTSALVWIGLGMLAVAAAAGLIAALS